MFEASLKFQTTEKQADKRQSWARKCAGSLYKGPTLPWILRRKHGKKRLAKLGSSVNSQFYSKPGERTTRGCQAKLFYPRKAQAEPRLHMKTRVP